jgi:hypothetical protein
MLKLKLQVKLCFAVDRQYQNGRKILEKMGRDNRFYNLSQEEKEEETLASQVHRNLPQR